MRPGPMAPAEKRMSRLPSRLMQTLSSRRYEAPSLHIALQESGKSLIRVRNAQIHFSAVSGGLALDDTDYIQFAAPSASLTLVSATWVDSLQPQVRGVIALGPLTITGGLLTFSPVTRFSLFSGRAIAESLAIDTGGIPQITGSFSAADVKIAAGSSLGASGKFSLQLASGGDLAVHAPYQLTFAAGSPGAQGRVIASAPIATGEIDFDGGGRLAVASGQVQFSLANGDSGLSGTIGGQLMLGVGTIPLAGTALVGVSGGNAQFAALNFTSSVGLSGPLTGLSISLLSRETPSFRKVSHSASQTGRPWKIKVQPSLPQSLQLGSQAA
jgi:hypothetical protein